MQNLIGALRLGSANVQGVRAARSPEPYFTALIKLFPAEAVLLYPLAVSIAAGDAHLRVWLIGIVAVFVIVLRTFATMDADAQADIPAIAVSVVSFLLYAASLGGFGWLPGGQQQTTQVTAFATIMWVALVPYILRSRK